MSVEWFQFRFSCQVIQDKGRKVSGLVNRNSLGGHVALIGRKFKENHSIGFASRGLSGMRYFCKKKPMHVFLVTPPFTQLNTPYPATAYLKGFLNTKGIWSTQADLGLEVILKIFSKAGLRAMFDRAETSLLSNNAQRIYNLREE